MAEQNMWKKQMLANKGKPNQPPPTNPGNTPSWVKNSPASNTSNTANTPPPNSWVKNNSTADNTPVTANTPPWMKANTNTVNQNLPTTPKVGIQTVKPSVGGNAPWMKQNQESVVKPESPAQNPPWKKNQEQTNVAPWAKSNSTVTPNQPVNKIGGTAASQVTTPPWGNKSVNSPQWGKSVNESPGQNNNNWKLKQMAQVQKQKKQRQEKNKQLQQQEKERKRLQKIQKQKQQEQNNIKRQLAAMSLQEQHSKKREQLEKEELERIEREKREKQQAERLERERKQAQEKEQERIRLEKERQIQLQKEKQLQRQKERQKERERERQREKQRQNQQRLEKQKAELQKIQSSKSKMKSKKKSKIVTALQNSKISSIRNVSNHHSSSTYTLQNNHLPTQRDSSQPQNLFHRYTRLLNQECSETDYRNKIAIQKLIIQTQLEFQRQCQKQISALIEKKKITNRKRKIVFSNNMQIRYGLCQGRKGENGLQFIKQQQEKLRNIFLYYEAITKCIVSLLKKKINIHFRVPLLNLGQFKGITFLIEYICEQLIDINQIDIGLFQQISNEVLILEKELQLCYDVRNDFLKPLNKNQLMVKKINIYDQDYYILYIKEDTIEPKPKRSQSSPQKSSAKIPAQLPNLTYLKLIQYITSESYMLPFYNPPITVNQKNLQLYEKIASPASKNLIKDISLANSINTVYSSCQGEVQQNLFFDLVIKQNKEIWDMIKIGGFSEKIVPSPIVLSYVQKISSVRFYFTNNFYNKKQKELIKSISPSVYIQKHEFQMLQFIRNLQKYISQDKEDLVEESMKMNRQLWQQITKSSDNSSNIYLLQLKQEVNYLLYKGKDSQALQILTKYQERVSNYAIQNIPISLLFIKVYVKIDAQIQLLKKLSQLLQILQFYFKEEIIIHSYVYTIVGSYYSKKENDEQRQAKVITFYEHAINIVLRLYGEKAQQVAEIYLSRAHSMLNLHKLQAFHKDMNHAVKIYKIHSKNNSKIAQCNYLMGKVCCIQKNIIEGVQMMQDSSNLFLKLQNYVQSLNISFEILDFLQGEQSKYQSQIQRIVQICFRYKSIWAFKKIVTILIDRELQCYTSLTIGMLYEILGSEGQQERSNEQIIIDLQQQIKGFTSFIEIVRWSLSILAAKVIIRKQASGDFWKAESIMKQVIHFYKNDSKGNMQSFKEQVTI